MSKITFFVFFLGIVPPSQSSEFARNGHFWAISATFAASVADSLQDGINYLHVRYMRSPQRWFGSLGVVWSLENNLDGYGLFWHVKRLRQQEIF